MTDQYLHYDEKLQQAKESGVKLYRYLNDKVVNPLKENLYVIIDEGSKIVSFVIQVLQENQHKVIEYMQKHYENVQVIISNNWMRLDFN